MKKDRMATQFIKVRDFAEAVGFDVEKWQISENAAGDGCICKMRLTAKDDPDQEFDPAEPKAAKSIP